MPTIDDSAPESVDAVEFQGYLKSSQMPPTNQVKSSDLSELFKVPESQQFTYATFSEEFEKYKVRIDLFKWLIGTVGLTLITYIINWGFRDREQGLVELQVYDKYASDKVVFAENPKNRKMLAQFYAHVTPSDKLKDGWKDYLDVVTVEVDAFNNNLKQSQNRVESLAKDTSKSVMAKSAYDEAKATQTELERINNLKLVDEKVPAIEFKTTAGKPNEALARDFELKGYQALFSRDLQKAIYNFTMSENSFNTYHNAYNIAKYLQSIQAKFVSNDKNWNELYRYIVAEFSWKMPADIKKKLLNPG